MMSSAKKKGRKAGRAWRREADMTNATPPRPQCPYNGTELRAEWETGFIETTDRNELMSAYLRGRRLRDITGTGDGEHKG